MASINYVVQRLAAAGLTVDVDGDFILCEDPGLDFERSHDGVQGVARWLRETLGEYTVATEELLTEPKLWSEEEQRAQADKELAEIAREEERLANEATGQEIGEIEPRELSPEYQAAELPEEETVYNFVKWILKALGRNAQPAADPPAREFAPSPPVKEHVVSSAQLALAKSTRLALAKRVNMMSPKELWQAQECDQDRGGIPRPEDYIRDMKLDAPVVVLVKGQRFAAPKGWKIKESRPSGKVLYYGAILQERKKRNGARGAKFALVRDGL